MARYAKVDVRIWDDDKVKALTPIPPCGQGLWIRLLVSRHRSAVPGLLCVGEAALSEEFGWSLEDFRNAFAEAKNEGLVKADWRSRVVWLPKAWKYNSPESPNVVRSWRIPWDETPECLLKVEIYQCLKVFIEGFKDGFKKAFAQACRMPSPNQEQEQEQEQEDLSLRAPVVRNVNAKSACDWLAFFNARFWTKMGKQRGDSSDAKATANLQDNLDRQSVHERAEDWLARERIVDEFLSSPDPATARAGWKFAFFVSSFDGLRIPPEKRPKVEERPTFQRQKQPPPATYENLAIPTEADEKARRARFTAEEAAFKAGGKVS